MASGRPVGDGWDVDVGSGAAVGDGCGVAVRPGWRVGEGSAFSAVATVAVRCAGAVEVAVAAAVLPPDGAHASRSEAAAAIPPNAAAVRKRSRRLTGCFALD